MRITIDSAVDYLLAIPAHRSSNQAHRKLGELALEELQEYRELGTDETEKAYNKAVIAAVLSAARAFSVERDRIAGIWQSIDEIKTRHLRLLTAGRALSPLAPKNYWARAVALISAAGISLVSGQGGDASATVSQADRIFNMIAKISPVFVIYLIVALVLLEIMSHIVEWIIGVAVERKSPIEKQAKWQKLTMGRYEEFTRKYILEHIGLHKAFFPKETHIQGYSVEKEEEIASYTEELLGKHLYFREEK